MFLGHVEAARCPGALPWCAMPTSGFHPLRLWVARWSRSRRSRPPGPLYARGEPADGLGRRRQRSSDAAFVREQVYPDRRTIAHPRYSRRYRPAGAASGRAPTAGSANRRASGGVRRPDGHPALPSGCGRLASLRPAHETRRGLVSAWRHRGRPSPPPRDRVRSRLVGLAAQRPRPPRRDGPRRTHDRRTRGNAPPHKQTPSTSVAHQRSRRVAAYRDHARHISSRRCHAFKLASPARGSYAPAN